MFRRISLYLLLGCWLIGCQSDAVQPTSTIVPTAVSTPSTVPIIASTATFVSQPATVTPLPVVQQTAVSVPATPTADPALQQLAEAWSIPLQQITTQNSGKWQFEAATLSHPLAIAATTETVFILDHGRVIQIERNSKNTQILLAPAQRIGDVPVVEPIDLSLSESTLYVLDRVGDIFQYDLTTKQWPIAWYGRHLDNSDGHYYVALTSEGNHQFLLESSYHYTQKIGESPRIWPLPEQLGVDIAGDNGQSYVLQQALDSTAGFLTRYQDATLDSDFVISVPLSQVREVAVSETAVYILDHAGNRLLQLDKTGQLQQLWQPPKAIDSIWVGADDTIILAGEDSLFFVGQPEQTAVFQNVLPVIEPSPFTQEAMATLDWALPIEGSPLTKRPLQMPGAPRHYRLGVHEGLDFYWGTGTPVRAVAGGTVIRIDVDYERPEQRAFNAQYDAVQAFGTTPQDALDFYRGRQVWIEHENGWVTRYAHLSQVNEQLAVGTAVAQGQLIGEVGNSGSPLSVQSETDDAHLHFEIWENGRYLGQYLRPVETWELILSLWK